MACLWQSVSFEEQEKCGWEGRHLCPNYFLGKQCHVIVSAYVAAYCRCEGSETSASSE